MAQTYIGTASGRMDVMGGIADYSGSMVLQMPISQKTTVQISLRTDDVLAIRSEVIGLHAVFETSVSNIPTDYEAANLFFKSQPNGQWASYVAGCLVVLRKEKQLVLRGLDILIKSDVPNGKGVSSSAALEVATLRALAQLYNLHFKGTELAILAQRVENLIVGAPCGLMDQLASCFGIKNHLLPILCQPDLISMPISIPSSIRFVAIDSGIRHAVSGATYGQVRTAAFMGYSMIAQSMNVSKEEILNAKENKYWKNLPYDGFLANLSVIDYRAKFQASIKNCTGADFLAEYEQIIDPISVIDPTCFYNVEAATAHPIYENERVREFKFLIENFEHNDLILNELGSLMYASHESYSHCGLGNSQTDLLVAMAKQFGPQNGIYGAKITGGGSGGTVCFLVDTEKGFDAVKELFNKYHQNFESKLIFFE